jgi:hypothetical protein
MLITIVLCLKRTGFMSSLPATLQLLRKLSGFTEREREREREFTMKLNI